MSRLIILFVLSLLPLSRLMAGDMVLLHLDKPLYVNGESLSFRLSVPPEICPDQALVQVHLVDYTGDPLTSFYIQMTQGTGHGTYAIPYDTKPGVYQLLATATDRKTREHVRLIQVPISIYDDLAEISTTSSDNEINPNPNEVIVQTLQITSKQSSYHPGDSVTVKIKVPGASFAGTSHLSLVLRDRQLFNGLGPTIFTSTVSLDWQLDPLIWLWGTIRKSPTESGRIQLVAYMPELGFIEYSMADSKGRFLLPLKPFNDDRSLQLLSLQRAGFEIEIDEPPLDRSRLGGTLIVNDKIMAYLDLSRRRKKLQQIFPEPLPPASQKPSYQPDWLPDRSIVIKDYDEFSNLLEFFNEINTALKLRYRNGNYRVKMVNPDRKPYHPGTPVFIVDNVIYLDPIEALTLDIRTVERVDLYNRTPTLSRYFGQLGNNGVVVITTNNPSSISNQVGLNLFSINGLPSKGSISEPEVTNGPKFRPMAFWNPMVVTSAAGEAYVTIPLSDDLSNYEIEVVGYDLEGEMTRGVLLLPVIPR